MGASRLRRSEHADEPGSLVEPGAQWLEHGVLLGTIAGPIGRRYAAACAGVFAIQPERHHADPSADGRRPGATGPSHGTVQDLQHHSGGVDRAALRVQLDCRCFPCRVQQ